MADIAKHIIAGDGHGLYVTSYRNPHDGWKYCGPQIAADSLADAESIAARLSYSGQPLTVDGMLVEEFPAEMADPAKRAAAKAQIDDEVRAAIARKGD